MATDSNKATENLTATVIVDAPAGESADTSDSKVDATKGLDKERGAVPMWNSLKPGPAFTGALTPSATTPGANTPGVFSFDEPFGEASMASVDPAALRAKMDHLHDGGLEGGFHHGDDHEHDNEEDSEKPVDSKDDA